MRRHAVVLFVLAILTIAGTAAAWGPDGHRIVAQVAFDRLTPRAKILVAKLLSGTPDPTLPGVANWADEVRDRSTERQHFVNFKNSDCHFTEDLCPYGQCVVDAIKANYAILRNTSSTQTQRAVALRLLVHFVGDVHQPLHAGFDADRGGNDYQVFWDGRGTNLHHLWDSQLLTLAETSSRPGAFRLFSPWMLRGRLMSHRNLLRLLPPGNSGWYAYAERLSHNTGAAPSPDTLDPAAWAEESCRIVSSTGFYPSSHLPDSAYAARWRPTMDSRLTLAGQRLAELLNSALR